MSEKKELDPMNPPSQGRFIDEKIGTLEAEAADQETQQSITQALKLPSDRDPSTYPSQPEGATYYNQPVLQKPVWIWSVPAYFYVGGTAGAALVLASAVQSVDGDRLRGLVQRCRWIGAGGIVLGSGFLVYDLGRPSRFLNMLRVFRPSSPLSVGSWLLAIGGPLAGGAALFGQSDGFAGRLADLAGHASALIGMPLAGYTGVVLADTAVPVWQEARRGLPVSFIGSAMAGTASLLEMMDLTARERRIVKRFAIVGKAAELGGSIALEREASRIERVGRPLKQGSGGRLWKAAKILSGASLLMSMLPGRSRTKRVLGGAMGTAGALCLRYALIEAGKQSAADPQATFTQQRAGHGAFEATRFAALAGSGERAVRVPEAERERLTPSRVPEEEQPRTMTGRPS